MRRWFSSVLAACMFVVAQTGTMPRANAAPGDLDAGFGTGGWALVGVDDDHLEHVTASTIQPDGRLIVVGSLDDDLAAWRFLMDGSLDTSFDAGGIAVIPFGSRPSHATEVAVQPDGRILIAGYAGAAGIIVRLQSTGEIDETFGGGDGTARIRIHERPTFVGDIELLSDGSIVGLAGSTRRARSVLIGLTSDGVSDSTFGDGGTVTVEGSLSEIDADDRGIVGVGAISSIRFEVVRYTMGGVPDVSFGGDGIRAYCLYQRRCDPQRYGFGPVDLAIDAGRVVIAIGGYSVHVGEFGGVMRMTSEGARDETFSRDGVAFANASNGAAALAVSDTGIDLAGFIWAGGGSGEYLPVIERFKANGTADTDFGDNGVVVATPDPYVFTDSVDILLQSDGKSVLLAIPAYDYNYDWFALVRFTAD